MWADRSEWKGRGRDGEVACEARGGGGGRQGRGAGGTQSTQRVWAE